MLQLQSLVAFVINPATRHTVCQAGAPVHHWSVSVRILSLMPIRLLNRLNVEVVIPRQALHQLCEANRVFMRDRF